MSTSNLLAYFSEQHWALRFETLEKLSSVLVRHAGGIRLPEEEIAAIVDGRRESMTVQIRSGIAAGISDDPSQEIQNQPAPYQMRGSVAVIPVGGVIAKYSSQVNGASQPRGTSTQAIERALMAAAKDDRVASILIMTDSPGGMVSGVQSLFEKIQKVDAIKPVVAYADDLMASAAYWIASGARRIEASTGATVGSIGVYAAVVDSSRRHETEGLRVHVVKAGANKGHFISGTPVTEQGLASMQTEIDAIYEQFLDAVASSRKGMRRAALEKLADGSVYVGKAALEAGLIDARRDVESTLNWMESQFGKKSKSSSVRADGHGPGAAPILKGMDMTPEEIRAAALATAAGNVGKVENTGTVGSNTNSDSFNIADYNKQLAAKNAAITATCSPFKHIAGVSDLMVKALSDPSCSLETVKTQVLELAAKGMAVVPSVAVSVGTDGAHRATQDLQIALMEKIMPTLAGRINTDDADARKVNYGQRVASGYGFASVEAYNAARTAAFANGIRRKSLLDLMADHARISAASRGQSLPSFATDDDVITFALGSGMSSGDFPLLLANVLTKALQTRLKVAAPFWDKIAREGSARDFKPRSLVQLSDASDLVLTPEGGAAPRAVMNERASTSTLATFSRTLSLTRQMLINDDLGAFSNALSILIERADILPDTLLIDQLALNSGAGPTLGDGTAMFHSTRGNLAGSGGALSDDTFNTAYVAMRKQRGFGPQREYLDIIPKVLLVTPDQGRTAMQIANNPTTTTLSSANSNVVNVYQGKIEPVIANRLSRLSSTAWYLFADPNEAPAFEVSFLNGNKRPTVSTITNGSALNQEYEVIFDCSVDGVQAEGAYRNAGA